MEEIIDNVEKLEQVPVIKEWNGETYTSAAGLRWCKKCVSCAHCKSFEDKNAKVEDLRYCKKYFHTVDRTMTCDSWQFGQGLGDGTVGVGREMAGRNLGRVKTLGFMRYRSSLRQEYMKLREAYANSPAALASATANYQALMDNSEKDYRGNAYFNF